MDTRVCYTTFVIGMNQIKNSIDQIQWGMNLTKFTGLQLPGGVQFNGDGILTQGMEAKQKLEEEMISAYSLPVHDMTG